MMDAWTSLVRNGKVGQDIAIAHPSPDDGISPCARLPQTGRALENAVSRIASRWTYTASLLSSTPAGRNSRRPGRGDRSSTPQSAAGSLTSVSEDHADEPNTTNRICSFTSIREHSSLSQLFSISFKASALTRAIAGEPNRLVAIVR